jgi:hypothetical protein
MRKQLHILTAFLFCVSAFEFSMKSLNCLLVFSVAVGIFGMTETKFDWHKSINLRDIRTILGSRATASTLGRISIYLAQASLIAYFVLQYLHV